MQRRRCEVLAGGRLGSGRPSQMSKGAMSYERMYVLHEAPSGITWLRAKEGRRRGLEVHVFCLAGTQI